MREETKNAAWAWSLFWQADNQRACSPLNSVPDDSPLDRVWEGFFQDLPKDSVILDVGTGNGALAVLAQKVLGDRAQVHGVDVAEIDPVTFVSSARGLQSITFHPGVTMEQLPFDDGYFDAVVGQYALEYSKLEHSVPEALRMLRSRGRFCFLVHAAGGALETRNSLQQRQAQTLLDSSLFQDLGRLLPAIVSAQTLETERSIAADCALQAARDEINRFSTTLQHLETIFADDGDTDMVARLLSAVRQIPAVRLQYTLPELLQQASDLEARLPAQALRLQAMLDAALDDAGLTRLQHDLQRHGASRLEVREASSAARGLLGYWVLGER